MSSSTTTAANQSNALINETVTHHYMRQFIDYLDNGIDFPELSQIRQLDVYLQSENVSCLLFVSILSTRNSNFHSKFIGIFSQNILL